MNFPSFPFASTLAVLAAAAALPAQELIAVNFQGQAFGVDVATGVARSIGPTGATRCNAMALHERVLYATAQTSVTGPRQLVTIDPITAQATVLFNNLTVDLRGLAPRDNTTELFGIADGAPDRLVRIDVVTGVVTNVGNTGFTGIQGLDGNDASPNLLAWDVNVGLVRIDKATGVGVDVDPAVGTQGVDIQFLTTFPTNNDAPLLGGRTSLYEVDRQTGVVTQIGATTNLADLRGGEQHRGRATLFGTGCLTATTTPATIAAKASFLAGETIVLRTPSHPPSTIALLLVGLSDAVYQGLPLPLDLDPLLGTNGCDLLVSADLTLAALGQQNGTVVAPFLLPPVLGATLFFQFATLEAVPGGLSFTDALKVEVPF
jgi:hypothetical protein